mmetsp:Transcript_174738/g.560468  ORF Transcript_174738/g.560468 Transcript_174738/m.560468 type:complete len:215 (+) Transcript_174738:280-924(+)
MPSALTSACMQHHCIALVLMPSQLSLQAATKAKRNSSFASNLVNLGLQGGLLGGCCSSCRPSFGRRRQTTGRSGKRSGGRGSGHSRKNARHGLLGLRRCEETGGHAGKAAGGDLARPSAEVGDTAGQRRWQDCRGEVWRQCGPILSNGGIVSTARELRRVPRSIVAFLLILLRLIVVVGEVTELALCTVLAFALRKECEALALAVRMLRRTDRR